MIGAGAIGGGPRWRSVGGRSANYGGVSAIAPMRDGVPVGKSPRITDDEVVVELEAPGFDEKEIDVEVTDHTQPPARLEEGLPCVAIP